MKFFLIVTTCLSTLIASDVRALDFDRIPLDDGGVIIGARGRIELGDDEKLHRFVAQFPASDKLVGIAIDSGGGSILEAEGLAQTVRNTGLATMVAGGNTCASACFLIFAAGKMRIVQEGARVGVHSVSEEGEETITAQAVTTMAARDARAYNVPPAIIGKMVSTPPTQMAWLTREDLVSMDVAIIPSERPQAGGAGAPLRPGGTPLSSKSSPADLAPTQTISRAFAEGLAERRAYEAWFAGLDPLRQGGATYWAENRSRTLKGERVTCGAPNASPEWLQGCNEARMRLTPTDRRRLSEPEYRAGWNAF